MNPPLGRTNCFIIINMAFTNMKSCQEQVQKKKKKRLKWPGQKLPNISNASAGFSNRLHILRLYTL